jgi:hypothetical protein
LLYFSAFMHHPLFDFSVFEGRTFRLNGQQRAPGFVIPASGHGDIPEAGKRSVYTHRRAAHFTGEEASGSRFAPREKLAKSLFFISMNSSSLWEFS